MKLQNWRSAMTIARELGLENIGDKYLVTSKPADKIKQVAGNSQTFNDVAAASHNLSDKEGALNGPAKHTLSVNALQSFAVSLTNTNSEQLACGYDQARN